MTERLPRRSWAPARTAPLLLAVQLVTLWQVSLRGLDYLSAAGRPALDTAAASPLAGLALLTGALLVLIGVAGRWGSAVIGGHALVGAAYLGLGGVALDDTVTLRPGALVAVLVAGAGTAVLVHPRAPTWARLAVAVPAMVAGQVALAATMGGDYRTGTGLVSAGVLHLTLAVATFALWQRTRLAEVVGAEQVPR